MIYEPIQKKYDNLRYWQLAKHWFGEYNITQRIDRNKNGDVVFVNGFWGNNGKGEIRGYTSDDSVYMSLECYL